MSKEHSNSLEPSQRCTLVVLQILRGHNFYDGTDFERLLYSSSVNTAISSLLLQSCPDLLDFRCDKILFALLFIYVRALSYFFSISMVEELLEYVMEPLLKFLIESGGDVLVANTWPWYKDIESTVPGVTETSCILSMFTSVLERYCSRETMERKYRSDSLTSDSDLQRRSDSVEDTREQKVFISNAFAYAFVWGIGGRMHKR